MSPEKIEPRVLAALKLLQKEVDDTAFCQRSNFALDKALLTLVSKSLRIGMAVCHLVAGGFNGEAVGLFRSALEAFFIAKYISSSNDPEARAHSYLEFRQAHYYNQEQIRQKYFPHIERPEGLTDEMLAETKRTVPKTRHWVSAYNMALDSYDHPAEINPQTGKGFQADGDYEGGYELTSHYVHSTAIATMDHLDGSPFRTAKRDDEEDRGFLALHFSLGHVYRTCIIVGRHWNMELQTDVHETVRKLLADLREAHPATRSHWTSAQPPSATQP